VEAINHLTHGLDVLATLPFSTERAQQELVLQAMLGPSLIAAKGYGVPEVEHTYARARELCRQIGNTSHLAPVLWGLWVFYLGRRELQTAHELGEQYLMLAQHMADPVLLQEAHWVLGATLFYVGDLAASQAHHAQSIALYDHHQHHALPLLFPQDPGVSCLALDALLQWLLGYPNQALQRSHEAVTQAQALAHPHSLIFAAGFAAVLHQFRREDQSAQARVQTAGRLATEQGFALWLVWETLLQGWVLTVQGQEAEGMAQMRQGLASWRMTGLELWRPYFLALLVDASIKSRQIEEGLQALAEALEAVEQGGERFYEAELYRLQGELLLTRSATEHTEAETCFYQALGIARHQQAKAFELRAAMSLARLWQCQGKRTAAHALLAPIYGWFTEGFDTADLQEAKALLEALA
jgi:predicted ATPase